MTLTGSLGNGQQTARPHLGHSVAQTAPAPLAAAPRETPYASSPAATEQTPTIEETMRRTVNPHNIDYGRVVDIWTVATVQATFKNIVWWVAVLAICGLLLAVIALWWTRMEWAMRQECFSRAASVVIGQRNAAFQRLREVVMLHNDLAERIDSFGDAREGYSQQLRPDDSILEGIEAVPEVAPSPVPAVVPAPVSTESLKPESADQGQNQLTLIPLDGEMSEPIRTAQGEKVYVCSGKHFVSYDDHLHQVRALERKVQSQRTTANRFREEASGLKERMRVLGIDLVGPQ